MKNLKTPLRALVICAFVLPGVFVAVSCAETSEQMAQRIKQLKESTGQTEADPLLKANEKLAAGTLQWKDIDLVREDFIRRNRSGKAQYHKEYIKAMDFFDKVIYLKPGSPGYLSNKSKFANFRGATFYSAMVFAEWDKDADRLFKYASDYLQDYPKGGNVTDAQRGMEIALKLKKDKELKSRAVTNKTAVAPESEAPQKDPEGDIKKALLSKYSNEIDVANMDNDESGMLMGSNMTEPRITIEWTNDEKTQANVAYDFRAPALRGKIGHYRELNMKRTGKQWVVETVLKDITSGMGNFQ